MARKIVNIVTTVILVILILFVVFLFITRLSGNSPAIFGYRVFRVSSGSMEPTLSVGDVILVKQVDPSEIFNGDIVTYKGISGELKNKEITHRVVEEPFQKDGVWYFQTRGDAVGATNDPVISEGQLIGKYVASLAFLNSLYTFFLSPGGLIAFIAVIVVLFGYEMISLVMSYKSIDDKDDDYYAPPNRKPKKKRRKS